MNAAAARAPASSAAHNDPALITGQGVTGVMIQFFSSNRDIFPSRFKRIHAVGTPLAKTPSVEIVQATAEVAISPVFDGIISAGFVLADGFSYLRPPREGAEFGKTTSVMRFQFYPARTHKFDSEGKEKWVQTALAPYFSFLTKDAYWKVAAYCNMRDDNRSSIGIKCSDRFLTTEPNGTPLTRKARDERGKPYGEPQPFVPVAKGQLRVIDGRLMLA